MRPALARFHAEVRTARKFLIQRLPACSTSRSDEFSFSRWSTWTEKTSLPWYGALAALAGQSYGNWRANLRRSAAAHDAGDSPRLETANVMLDGAARFASRILAWRVLLASIKGADVRRGQRPTWHRSNSPAAMSVPGAISIRPRLILYEILTASAPSRPPRFRS